MPSCAVKLCNKRSNTSSLAKDGVTFHLFPKSPRRKQKWLDAINQAGQWFPTKLSTVCSEHFYDDCFNIRKNNRRRLTDTAVPSLKLPCFGQFSNLTSNEVSLKKKTLFTSSMNNEHQASFLNTPLEKKMYMDIRRLNIGIRERNLKIKRLTNEKRSFRKKIAKLETLLKTLMEKSLITEEDSAILESIGGECTDLIRRHVIKNQKGSKYSPALRSFALTLYYYSAKAYTFVRKTFNTCLPHPRTLNKWYQCIGGEAGFTKEAFNAIRLKVKYSNSKLACTLVMDEMAIRRKIEWIPESKRYYGYVDMGTGIDNDCLDSAKEALVFLLVAINGNWKVPVAYFLVNGVSGDQRASLVTKCVEMSHVAGVTIAALTFDGCPSNLAMAKKLGCSFDPHNLKPCFIHPYTSTEIAVFLDPCHMLKLVRNAFEAYGTFIDYTGNSVEWRFLKQLNDIQEQEQFHMANKLRRHHIDFKNKIMKVKLASQLFSRSVADALQFCHIQLNLEQFFKSTPTSTFISLINDLFDILNSRTRQWGLKRAINNENKNKIFTVLDHAVFYIKNMKALVKTGKTGYKTVNILESGRKTGFIGFIVCAESTKILYKNSTDGGFVTYLPTYKISQDHIELLFCNIRSHGGNNNNPTARQFKSIYKKILVHTQLSVSDRGNCVPLEEICILTSPSAVDRINATTGSCRYEDSTPEISALSLEDMEDIISISKFSDSVIEYISGFVVRSLQKTIKCEKCIAALVAPASSDSLISRKDRCGLTYASPEVINICRKCELYLKGAMLESDGKHLKPKYTTDFLISKVLRSLIGTNLFNVLQIHQFDTDPLTNHIVELAKAVMEKYFNTRLMYLSNNYDKNESSKRQMYNKLILFKGQ